jgi:hypothetical protein
MNDTNNVPMSAVPVDVYRNLHKNTWSIRSRTTGRVIRRADNVVVKNVKFVVQPAGRQRVLDEERKNVHAFVRGTISPISTAMLTQVAFNVQIKYNPYILEPDQRAGHFYEVDTEETVGEAPIVVLDTKGAWIQGDGPKGLSDSLEKGLNV